MASNDMDTMEADNTQTGMINVTDKEIGTQDTISSPETAISQVDTSDQNSPFASLDDAVVGDDVWWTTDPADGTSWQNFQQDEEAAQDGENWGDGLQEDVDQSENDNPSSQRTQSEKWPCYGCTDLPEKCETCGFRTCDWEDVMADQVPMIDGRRSKNYFDTFRTSLRVALDEAVLQGIDERTPLLLEIPNHSFPQRLNDDGSVERKLIVRVGFEHHGKLELMWKALCKALTEKKEAVEWRASQWWYGKTYPIKRKISAIKTAVSAHHKQWQYRMEPMVEPTHVNVKNEKSLRFMLTNLAAIPQADRKIGLDLEFALNGHSQARHGDLCTMQIANYSTGTYFLVDLLWLKSAEGNPVSTCTANNGVTSLKSILESPSYDKLMWDCRQDANGLFWHFDIKLAAVVDVQLMEVYRRQHYRRPKFGTVIDASNVLDEDERKVWLKNKNAPSAHGRWMERPLTQTQKAYAIGDVIPLLKLYRKLAAELSVGAMGEILRMTKVNAEETWEQNYKPVSPSLSPWFKEYGSDADEEWP